MHNSFREVVNVAKAGIQRRVVPSDSDLLEVAAIAAEVNTAKTIAWWALQFDDLWGEGLAVDCPNLGTQGTTLSIPRGLGRTASGSLGVFCA